MAPRSQVSDLRRPNQGALVVLLAAMAMTNTAVLLLVFVGDRLWGGGDAMSATTEVAQAGVAPGDPQSGQAGAVTDPVAPVHQDPADEATPETGRLPHEEVGTDPPVAVQADLVEAEPDTTPAEGGPVVPTTADLPPLEFFGIPVFD